MSLGIALCSFSALTSYFHFFEMLVKSSEHQFISNNPNLLDATHIVCKNKSIAKLIMDYCTFLKYLYTMLLFQCPAILISSTELPNLNISVLLPILNECRSYSLGLRFSAVRVFLIQFLAA